MKSLQKQIDKLKSFTPGGKVIDFEKRYIGGIGYPVAEMRDFERRGYTVLIGGEDYYWTLWHKSMNRDVFEYYYELFKSGIEIDPTEQETDWLKGLSDKDLQEMQKYHSTDYIRAGKCLGEWRADHGWPGHDPILADKERENVEARLKRFQELGWPVKIQKKWWVY
jgi:hypothetical protein